MLEDDTAFAFSVSMFPRAPNRQGQIHIPLAASINPFSTATQVISAELPACARCGAFVFSTDNRSRSCQFCGNYLLESVQLPDCPSCEWVTATSPPTKSFILIDATSLSRSCSFYDAVLESLPSALPPGIFVISAFTTELRILTPRPSLLCYPTLDNCPVPPFAFHSSAPHDLSPLLPFRSFRACDVLNGIRFAMKAVGPNGRVVVFLSSRPVDFVRVPGDLNLAVRSTPNFNPDWVDLQRKLRKLNIIVDFFVNIPSSNVIDTTAISEFVKGLYGNLVVVDNSVFFRLSEIAGEFLATCPVSAQFLFPLNFACPHSERGQWFGRKTIMFNSSQAPLIPIEMLKIGPQAVPFQCWVKWQSAAGSSIIRVFSRMIACYDCLVRVFDSCDQKILLKVIVTKLLNEFASSGKGVGALSSHAIRLLTPFFRAYRKYAYEQQCRPDQFVFPKALGVLPAATLGALKSCAFAYGTMQAERFYWMDKLANMSPRDVFRACCPVMMDITDFVSDQGPARLLALTKQSLWSHQLVLLDDVLSTWIWIGKSLKSMLCIDLFNEEEAFLVEMIEKNETAASQRLFSLVKSPIKLCVEDGIGHHSFLCRLILDAGSSLPCERAFIGQLQMSILDRLGK
jgi:hypothetical protein